MSAAANNELLRLQAGAISQGHRSRNNKTGRAPFSKNADTGLITGTSDGAGGTVTVSVTLTKEHRLVHDKDNIVWGNEYEQSRTYETAGPVMQQFTVNGTGHSRR